MTLKESVIRLLKEYAAKKLAESSDGPYYTDIGHDWSEENQIKIWWCDTDVSNFEVKSGFGGHPRDSLYFHGVYWGRFDPKKNVVSVASNCGDRFIPEDLKRRLQFEFGDDVIFKTFFNE